MTTDPLPGCQDRRSAVLGWLLAITFIVLLWNILELPRTALDQREFLRAFHNSVGFLLLALSVLRIAWWFSGPPLRPPAGLPESSFAASRAVLMALLLTFAATGLIGFGYAWADGQDVALFGLPIPRLVAQSHALRTTLGYLHSALGFYYLMLFTVWLVYGTYQHLRYRSGMRRLLPGMRV